jgi:ubiquinone/menaquinone biosynthesis C-methylase UbiE
MKAPAHDLRSSPLARAGAALYDFMNEPVERRLLGERRRQLLQDVRGNVLEVGAGTGADLPRFPRVTGLHIVLIDPSAAMLARARRRAQRLGLAVEFHQASGEALPLADESFDAVVFTLSLCTIPDPDKALAEARRVLRPEGSLLLMEHVRAGEPRLARWQDRLEPVWKLFLGCHPNRDTRKAVEAAGFRFEDVQQRLDPDIPIAIVRPQLSGTARRA